MITTKRIPKIHTQKELRRQSLLRTTKKKNHLNEKGSSKGRNEEQKIRKTCRKQITKWLKSLPRVTLNVNGLNSPIKIQKLAEWIKKLIRLMLCTTYLFQIQRHRFGVTDGKWCPRQTVTNRELGGYINIRKDRLRKRLLQEIKDTTY